MLSKKVREDIEKGKKSQRRDKSKRRRKREERRKAGLRPKAGRKGIGRVGEHGEQLLPGVKRGGPSPGTNWSSKKLPLGSSLTDGRFSNPESELRAASVRGGGRTATPLGAWGAPATSSAQKRPTQNAPHPHSSTASPTSPPLHSQRPPQATSLTGHTQPPLLTSTQRPAQ